MECSQAVWLSRALEPMARVQAVRWSQAPAGLCYPEPVGSRCQAMELAVLVEAAVEAGVRAPWGDLLPGRSFGRSGNGD